MCSPRRIPLASYCRWQRLQAMSKSTGYALAEAAFASWGTGSGPPLTIILRMKIDKNNEAPSQKSPTASGGMPALVVKATASDSAEYTCRMLVKMSQYIYKRE